MLSHRSQTGATLCVMSKKDDQDPPVVATTPLNASDKWRFAETQDALESVDRVLSKTVPALSIVCHPDIARIGDVAHLTGLSVGQVVRLSRLEPTFAAPGASSGQVLADPRISRRPVQLESLADGGIRLGVRATTTQVLVDGVVVTGEVIVPSERLTRGVTVQLGSFFTLLLHLPSPALVRHPRFGMVGDNQRIEKLRGDVTRVADVDVPVLIRGESGTGKELLAHAIHDASGRRQGPFVAVNMAAITPSTAASELFGHVRGAFTGASRDHAGLFARANGGTLFLDEIGETPAELQAMLLRVLETGEVQAVGATRARKVDVRLVAATDSDLETATEQGKFKLPLLHRLAGYELRLPPLRERKDDIGRLFAHFLKIELEAVGEQHRIDPAGPGAFIPATLMSRLCAFDWPGNVRQLRNIVRQLVISSRGEGGMVIDHAIEEMLNRPHHHTVTPNEQTSATVSAERLKPSELTEDVLLNALRRHDYRPGPVALEFGMSRTTLYALIEKSTRIKKAKDLEKAEIEIALQDASQDVGVAAHRLEVSKRGLQLRIKELFDPR